jgi:hypothetical protein
VRQWAALERKLWGQSPNQAAEITVMQVMLVTDSQPQAIIQRRRQILTKVNSLSITEQEAA